MSKNVKQKKKRRTKIYFILEIGSFFVLILLVGILFLTQQINKEKEDKPGERLYRRLYDTVSNDLPVPVWP